MSLRVHHYYPAKSTNVGDTLVAHAIQTALRRHLGDITVTSMHVNHRHATLGEASGLLEANVQRSNLEADLVVVGGSNLLEPRKPSRRNAANFRWHWGVQTEVEWLQALRPPVLLLGMGSGSEWRGTIRPYTSKAATEIRTLFQMSLASAVRDEPTREALEKIGVTTECTGCPVTFLTDRQVQFDAGKPLIVSLPPARILKTWSGRWFMHRTMNYLRWLRKNQVEFVVTLHERADLDFASHWVPKATPLFYTENVSELITRYEECCAVIGFRLHAALLSLGLGKPIIPVNVDWRGRGFSHTFGLQDVALEPDAWNCFTRLRILTNELLRGGSSLETRLRERKEHFRLRYESFLSAAMTRLWTAKPLAA
ncbi:MAG: polysaccharide pyruvyl transferase family protein [Gemmatales bacterium]